MRAYLTVTFFDEPSNQMLSSIELLLSPFNFSLFSTEGGNGFDYEYHFDGPVASLDEAIRTAERWFTRYSIRGNISRNYL
ncbi:MAG: hypothetical protein Sylvanvirus10_17 [Sylvanvirus sp.]|uniref:Uncharacterized protein n=1 Tax=Sylvanvirus sp. TaxID=2487774 RepID=A0A3G5AI19_9VIRU|nr:MAG: hypothetical protein Sylvanvirus10_17 [Sylvanvirus sp.]